VNANIDYINPISGEIATFLSDRSILRFADIIGVEQLVEKFHCLGNDLIREVMKAVTLKQITMIEKRLFSTSTIHAGQTVKKPATGVNISKNFLKMRENTQKKTNLRVAIVGCLHRTALATYAWKLSHTQQ
jgi:hypothetical protein